MKLQVSLDRVDTQQALDLLAGIADLVDIIEVGTPLIVRDGLHAVRRIRQAYPNHLILADLKAMDGGAYEAEMAIGAGADIVTVLSVANDSTIRGAVSAAHRLGGKVMVDMIESPNLAWRASQIDDMGADYICVHTAKDVQAGGSTPLQDLKTAASIVKNTQVAVAGGIDLTLIDDIAAQKPEILIVGKGITGAASPRAAAAGLKEHML